MAVGCGAKCAKCILFGFNVVFWLIGLSLLTLGLLVLFNPSAKLLQDFVSGMDSSLRLGCYLLIVVGVLVAIIGLSGCCGAIRESSCLLFVYVLFLVILLLMQIGLATLVSLRANMIQDAFGDEFYLQMKNYHSYPSSSLPSSLSASRDGNSNSAKNMVDQFQFEILECCGDNATEDWKTTDWYRMQVGLPLKEVPPSCCKRVGYGVDTGERSYLDCARNSIYSRELRFNTGCRQKLKEWMQTIYPYALAIFISIAIIEVLGIFLACCLCVGIRNEYAMIEHRDYM